MKGKWFKTMSPIEYAKLAVYLWFMSAGLAYLAVFRHESVLPALFFFFSGWLLLLIKVVGQESPERQDEGMLKPGSNPQPPKERACPLPPPNPPPPRDVCGCRPTNPPRRR